MLILIVDCFVYNDGGRRNTDVVVGTAAALTEMCLLHNSFQVVM